MSKQHSEQKGEGTQPIKSFGKVFSPAKGFAPEGNAAHGKEKRGKQGQ